MSEPVVALHREGGVLRLTLNRPELRNAMSLAMVDELARALVNAEHDGVTRVVVLRGAGGHFSAGADLKDMAAARLQPPERIEAAMAETNARFGRLCAAFARSPLATVAVLEGTVMGGGLGLACVADVAIAADTASFRLPETSLGLVPAQIAPYLVERLGYSQARRLAVSGGRLDARAALAIGLVHELHTGAALDAAVQRVLADILACAPGAVARTKALVAMARFTPAPELIEEAASVFARAAAGPEGIEGTTAFLQKRKARWMPQ